MTEPGERDERITALEADVAALRSRLGRAEQDAAAARVLARGADRDVADLSGEFREFRTEMRDFKSEMQDFTSEMRNFKSEMRDFRDQNNRVLSALRADMVDMRAHMDDRFGEIRGLLDGQAAWNRQLADMLGVLIRRQDDGPADPA